MRAGAEAPEDALWNCLLKYGRLERIHARLNASIEYLEEALSICRAQSMGDQSLALTLSELARSYYDADRIDDGRSTLEEALSLWHHSSKTKPYESVWLCGNASSCYLSQKNYANALEFADRARDICESQLGADHPMIIEPLIAKAFIGLHQMNITDADAAAHRCLKIAQNKLGLFHYNVGQAFGVLAALELLRGNAQQAESQISQALEIALNTFGKEHPQTLELLQLRAFMLARQGKIDESINIAVTEVLPALRNIHGDAHSKVAECANLLIFNLEQAGRLADAEVYAKLNMDVTRKVFGEGHPRSILAATKLGMLLFRQNKPAEAEASLNDCLKAYTSLLCEDTTETAELASSLASLCTRLGRWEEAESLMKEAKQICERLCGVDDIRTKSHAALLRVIELKNPSRARERASSVIEAGEQPANKEQEARAINQEVALGLKDIFDSQMKLGLKGTAIQSLQTAALMSVNSKNWSQAEAQLRQLLVMLEEQLGPQDPSVAQTSFMLGTMLLFQQKLGASDALQRAISILERQHGSEHVGLASPLALLALASGIDGRSDEAERYFDRCRSIREKSGTLNSPDFIGIAKKHALFLRKANREDAAKKVEAMLATCSSFDGESSTN